MANCGEVMEVAFSRPLAMQALGDAPEPGNHIVTITGVFQDGNQFMAEVEILLDADALPKMAAEESLPTEYSLGVNKPNPFNPSTVIEFSLPQTSSVKLEIFNVMGQKVRTLVNAELSAGYHAVEWHSTNDEGRAVANGIYFYRLEADDFVQTRKMILLK
jgi:hypothetical protein